MHMQDEDFIKILEKKKLPQTKEVFQKFEEEVLSEVEGGDRLDLIAIDLQNN